MLLVPQWYLSFVVVGTKGKYSSLIARTLQLLIVKLGVNTVSYLASRAWPTAAAAVGKALPGWEAAGGRCWRRR